MSQTTEQKLGGFAATSLGIGAIVGGGILLLAGPAFSVAGPAVMVAFVIDFSIAIATAFSMRKLVSMLPESGGAYLWAKRLWSVDAAFPVGWLIWLSAVLGASLNAIGIGLFAAPVLETLQFNTSNYSWLIQCMSLTAVVFLTASIALRGSKGSSKLNALKIILFVALLVIGIHGAWIGASSDSFYRSLSPFASKGWNKVLMATGLVFVAFQGFDVIANLATKVSSPKLAGRAMFGSLTIALAIYLPLVLLFCLTNASAPSLSDAFVADVIFYFGGRIGWWLVITCGLIAMYLAIEANLLSASTVLESMAQDGTVFTWLTSPRQSSSDGTASKIPVAMCGIAIFVLTYLLGDINTAASTASFAFVVLFAFTNIACIFACMSMPSTKLQILVSIYGALGCLCIGTVLLHGSWIGPSIVALSLLSGSMFYFFLLAGRAQVREVFDDAGRSTVLPRSELALVPVANPETAQPLIDFGSMFINEEGKLVLLSITEPGTTGEIQPLSVKMMPSVKDACRVESLVVRLMPGQELWSAISDTAHYHKIDTVIIGVGEDVMESDEAVSVLLQKSKANLLIIRPGQSKLPKDELRILVPVSPFFANRVSRAKVLRSFLKKNMRNKVTFLRVYEPKLKFLAKMYQRVANWKAKRILESFANDCGQEPQSVLFEPAPNIDGHLCQRSGEFDILVLGLPPLATGRKTFTPLIKDIMSKNSTSTIFLICSRN